MYKIIGADAKEYGPITLDQVRDWLAQKRISSQTRVQVGDSKEWVPAGQVPELAALFAAASPARVAGQGAPPPISLALPHRPSSGMAVVSFILGLCSFVFCLSIISGLPAILLGHIARRRATRSPERYGGKGLAMAGIVLGYVSFFATFLVIFVVMQAPQMQGPFRPRHGSPPISGCQNNLRQIGLAFKVWALEHNDQYPFNVSSNSGGSLEFCARDAEGFEKDPVPHLIIIANDLSTPSFLVCPQDSSKHIAADFSSLQAANVSYRLRTGTNVNGSSPQEILAVCPVHGYVLYCDGSVRKKGQ
jgi:hypothetical protein